MTDPTEPLVDLVSKALELELSSPAGAANVVCQAIIALGFFTVLGHGLLLRAMEYLARLALGLYNLGGRYLATMKGGTWNDKTMGVDDTTHPSLLKLFVVFVVGVSACPITLAVA